METIASLFHAVTRAARGAFDLGAMAFGVAPAGIALADAACVPLPAADCASAHCSTDPFDDAGQLSRGTREALGRWDGDIFPAHPS